MALDAHSLQDLVTFLLPVMSTDQERTSLYTLAFGPDHPLLYQLRANGPSQAALTTAMERLLAFGDIRPGVPALWALLEVVRQQVGLDKQSQIDRFRALLGLPPIALPDRVFVSYSRKNEPFARRIELDLHDAGLKVWFDRVKIRGGEEWRQSIQRGIERADFVVFCLSPDSVASEVCHWELNTAQQSGKLIIPIMLIDCLALLSEPLHQPIAWLKDRHILNFTQADEYGRHFKELLAALPGYNPPDSYYEDALDARQIPNPFRGLEAFRELDYHYFAGRENAVADLAQRVQDPTKPRLLAVVGASGSGKSSLVRAGLLPTLRDVPNLQWETAVFKPGTQPLLALAERLELRVGQSAAELRETFLRNPSSLHELVKATLSGHRDEARFLLVVDQCEEIFAPAADAERQAFLDVLHTAVTVPQGPIHVLLTLRADFFTHLSAYPTLASLIEDNLFIATAMTADQLRRCIEIPAQKVGLIYEAGLVDQILEAVREQPGALPLLQYALKELYERRHGRVLTTQAYSDIGGVQGALATRADAIFEQLNDAQKTVMRRLLLQLVEVGDDAVTRRRMRLSSLQLRDVTQEDLRAVADGLTAEQARLLVVSAPISDDDPNNDAEIDLEVSHEALLTHWERLARWIADDRDDLRRGSEYLQLAQAWHAAGRRETSYLLMGGRLITARDWLTRADATTLQHDFIEASIAYQAQEIAHIERLTREFDDASKRAVQNRTLAGIIAVVAFVLAGSAALIGANAVNAANLASTREAAASIQIANASTALAAVPPTLTRVAEIVQEGENRIESQRLAALAQGLLNEGTGKIETAALLGIAALNTGYSEQADAALVQAIDQLFIKNRFIHSSRSVESVAFSPDGKMALSGSDDKIILWDTATGKAIRVFTGFNFNTASVAFSPDGKTALSSSYDLTLWDVATGETIRTFISEGGSGNAVFSPDGKTALSHSENTITLWEIASGLPLRTFPGFTSYIATVALAPDGQTFLSGSGDGELILWDIATGEQIRTFPGHEDGIKSVAFSPDGKTALSGSYDSTLILWDIAAGEQIRTFAFHRSPVSSVAFSPDAKTALSGSYDHTLILWDIATGEPLRTFAGHEGIVNSVAFAPDGKTALSGGDDPTIILWALGDLSSADIPIGHVGRTFTGHIAAFSADGKTALSGSRFGEMILWDVVTSQPIRTFTGNAGNVTSITLSADGKTALSCSADGTLILWDVTTGQPIHTLAIPTIVSRRIPRIVAALAPDGKTVLSSSYEQTLTLWDITTGEQIHNFTGHTSIATSLALAPDGKTALSSSIDALILWDVATGEQIRTFADSGGYANSVAFSPDGKMALSDSGDSVILWDISTGEQIRTFTGHIGLVNSVAFAPDGKTAFSGSSDRTIILWNIATGAPLRTFTGYTSSVVSVVVAPDGKTILGGADDGLLRLWDTDYRDFITYACGRVYRDFDYDEDERSLYGIAGDEPTCSQSEDGARVPMSTGVPTAVIPVWTPIASPTASQTPTSTPGL